MHRMIDGCFDAEKNALNLECSGVYGYQSEEVDLYICGDIWVHDPEQMNQGAEIVAAFTENPETVTTRIKGMYIALFYQKQNKAVYVYHDRNTSPLPFYYCSSENKVFFGTSLKRILANSRIHRELNEDVLSSFVYNGTVLGAQTLLKNVYKLAPFSALQMSAGGTSQFEVFYPVKKYTEEEAKAMWEPTLEKIIASYVSQNKAESEICMTLSSGFDSNYILHIIDKYRNPDERIHAYSLGGKHGINELPKVKENVRQFDNLTLTTKVVDQSALQKFPDVVWRMEGLIYERGIFLHHELAELLSASGIDKAIGGDAMDQVLLKDYYEANRETTNEIGIQMGFKTTPYLMFAALYIKKNGVLANSYGVTQLFPFADARFADIACAAAALNKDNKLYHREICRKVFRKDIYDRASKVGGATEAQAFFDNYRQLRKFYRSVKKTDAYKRYADIVIENCREKPFQYGKEILRRVLSSVKHRKNKLTPFLLNSEEKQLQNYMKLLYLDLFITLFMSGKYDGYLDKEGIDFSLKEIYS